MLEDDEAVVRADRELRGEIYGLQARRFLPREHRVGAIGQKDIGLAAFHHPCVLVPSGGSLGAVRSARELERFLVQCRIRARLDLTGLREQLPCVISGRVGLRRRRAEAQVALQHLFQQGLRCHAGRRLRQGAELVAREQRNRSAAARLHQGLRVLHVRRCEDMRRLALFDPLTQQPRCAEHRVDGRAVGIPVGLRDVAQRRPETAGGVQAKRLARIRGCVRQGHDDRHGGKHEKPHPAVLRCCCGTFPARDQPLPGNAPRMPVSSASSSDRSGRRAARRYACRRRWLPGLPGRSASRRMLAPRPPSHSRVSSGSPGSRHTD